MNLRSLARGIRFSAFDLVRRYHNVLPQFTALYSGNLDEPGAVFPKESQFISTLTRLLMPDRILEIGIGRAGSTVAFAEALKKNGRGRLISVDITEETARRARVALRVHGLVNLWSFILGNSNDETVRARVSELVERADIIFIDGDHSFEGALGDFERYHDLLADNGIIMFHDTGPFPIADLDRVQQLPFPPNEEQPVRTRSEEGIYHRPGVARAIDWIVEHHPEYTAINLHTLREACCGIAIIQRKSELYLIAEGETKRRVAEDASP